MIFSSAKTISRMPPVATRFRGSRSCVFLWGSEVESSRVRGVGSFVRDGFCKAWRYVFLYLSWFCCFCGLSFVRRSSKAAFGNGGGGLGGALLDHGGGCIPVILMFCMPFLLRVVPEASRGSPRLRGFSGSSASKNGDVQGDREFELFLQMRPSPETSSKK